MTISLRISSTTVITSCKATPKSSLLLSILSDLDSIMTQAFLFGLGLLLWLLQVFLLGYLDFPHGPHQSLALAVGAGLLLAGRLEPLTLQPLCSAAVA